MAGDDPQEPENREVEAAERERRRLDDAEEPEPGLDGVRRALRRHDEQLGPPDRDG